MGHRSGNQVRLSSPEQLRVINDFTETRFTPPDADSRSTYPFNVSLASREGRVSRQYISQVINKVEKIIGFLPKNSETDDLTSAFFWRDVVKEASFYDKVEKIGKFLCDITKNPQLYVRLGKYEPELTKLANIGENIVAPVVITNSHRNDHLILDSVLRAENVDPNRVGVVVLDRHTDTLGSGGVEDFGIRASAVNAFLHKGINQVAIVGTPDDKKEVVTKESMIAGADRAKMRIINVVKKLTGNPNPNFDETIKNYKKIIELIQNHADVPEKYFWMVNPNFVQLAGAYLQYMSLARDDIKVHSNTEKFSPVDTAKKIVSDFKQAGVGCFVLSVDFDVLDLWHEEITTTMYSPFAILGLLSNINIGTLDAMIERIEKTFVPHVKEIRASEDIITIAELMHNISHPDLMRRGYYDFLRVLTTNPMDSPNKLSSTPKEHMTSFDGMKIEEVREFIRELKIQAAEQGLQFGIQRGNGTPFYGTLTEIACEYPDYMGKTVAAIANITSEIVK